MVRRVVDGNGKRMKLLVVDVKSGHPRVRVGRAYRRLMRVVVIASTDNRCCTAASQAYRVLTLWALAFAAEMQELATAAANEAAAES